MDTNNLSKLIADGKDCGYDMKELIPGKSWELLEFKDTLGKVLTHEDIISNQRSKNPHFFKAMDENGMLAEIVHISSDNSLCLIMLTAEAKKIWG